MRELEESLREGDARGLIALTFDDGYRDFVQEAVPVLRCHSFSATVYVVVGKLGGVNDWDSGRERQLLSAEEVVAVAAAGIEVGSHGWSHRDLAGLEPSELDREVRLSKRVLEGVLDDRVTGFCYPYGSRSTMAESAVEAAGYEYGAAVSGPATPFGVPRVYLGEQDKGLKLLAKLLLLRVAATRRRTS